MPVWLGAAGAVDEGTAGTGEGLIKDSPRYVTMKQSLFVVVEA